jgi:protein TonB
VHLALIAGLLQWRAPTPPSPPEKPLVRMVFVEPPPPAPAAATAKAVAVVPRKPKAARPVKKRPSAPVKATPEPAPIASPPIVDALAQPVETEALPDVAAGPPAAAESGAAPAGVVGGVAGGAPGGIRGARVVPASQVAHRPVLVRRVEPAYPRAARREGIEGLVVVEAILGENGRIEPGAKILRSVPMLDEAALTAVTKWRFRAARDADGSPRRVILEIPLNFVLR